MTNQQHCCTSAARWQHRAARVHSPTRAGRERKRPGSQPERRQRNLRGRAIARRAGRVVSRCAPGAASLVELVKMEEEEEEERLRPFVFLMTYMLLKRRRDLNHADIQRRNEIQRRIRHRQYFFQRQRRMLMVSRPCCRPSVTCIRNPTSPRPSTYIPL